MSNAVQSDLNSSYHLFYGELYKEAAVLNLLAEQLAESRDARNAFLGGERERLLKVARPFFQNLSAEYDITHCYFHTVERNVFLRVHYPDLHGDPIDRFTLREAERTGSVSYGLELGTMGTLTLRVVTPWRVDGRVIGYLELGKEIDQVLDEMKKILEIDLVLIVDKQYLDKEKWGQGEYGSPGEAGDWDQFSDFVVFAMSREKMPPVIQVDLSRPHHFHENLILEFREAGQQYLAGFAPLLDASNKDIGDIILIKNFTELKTVAQRVTLVVLFGYFFSILLYIGFVFAYLRRIKCADSDSGTGDKDIQPS
ncbi:MAG: cache domain-containing protein [Desulfobulbales bacterium]|nr:cache domain-containing protein [Desulfobulbales bacterium]